MNDLVPARGQRIPVDYTGLHDPPGSRGWLLARRSLMVTGLSDIKNNVSNCRQILAEVEKHGGWQHLRGLKNRPFSSFDEFCASPNGFGMTRDRIEERLSSAEHAQELAASEEIGPPLSHVEAGKLGGRGKKKASVNNTGFSRGSTNAATIVAKLKRDHPDIAKQLASGEFKSARAAGIAAGIVKVPSPLEIAKRAVDKLSSRDRAALLKYLRDEP